MTEANCDACRWLLHYEFEPLSRKYDLPRCSIQFRNGNNVSKPCLDFIKREIRKEAKLVGGEL